ncbi:threonylcarbamoyl-AMP synthase [Nitrosopumilus sp. K4]|uniref:L-threonylcarbamoyladenylate synthase n=1 Tax=Nitrosopumilus sp. K4 TaxID=2795383 RepID=UPI001BA45416|nr:L-threonylcarbamoyladenylate synthase [Nitrosopumilus sp. K4]QUC64914.1 threonylcarbamoyl-AMP synthase [Nitrosopumilus sp. K4]
MKVNCDPQGIEKANEEIKKGGVVIFPTDTVYGIGCNPYNENSVKKIYEIKSREETKFLPILSYSKETTALIVEFDDVSMKLAEKFWPGPLTLVLKLKDDRLKKPLKINNKIAIRVPKNNCVLQLLKKCHFLIGTSANISGQESFTDPEKCYQSIKGFDLFLDGGKISGGVPSTIAEVEDGKLKILREGVLTKKELMEIL